MKSKSGKDNLEFTSKIADIFGSVVRTTVKFFKNLPKMDQHVRFLAVTQFHTPLLCKVGTRSL